MNDFNLLVKQGESALQNKLYSKATEFFEKALLYDPNDLELLELLADTRLNIIEEIDPSKDKARLIELSNKTIELYDRILEKEENGMIFFKKGWVYLYKHEYEEAIINIDIAFSLEPYHYSIWFSKGNTLYFLRNLEKAISIFDKMLVIEDIYYIVVIMLKCLILTGLKSQAKDFVELVNKHIENKNDQIDFEKTVSDLLENKEIISKNPSDLPKQLYSLQRDDGLILFFKSSLKYWYQLYITFIEAITSAEGICSRISDEMVTYYYKIEEKIKYLLSKLEQNIPDKNWKIYGNISEIYDILEIWDDEIRNDKNNEIQEKMNFINRLCDINEENEFPLCKDDSNLYYKIKQAIKKLETFQGSLNKKFKKYMNGLSESNKSKMKIIEEEISNESKKINDEKSTVSNEDPQIRSKVVLEQPNQKDLHLNPNIQKKNPSKSAEEIEKWLNNFLPNERYLMEKLLEHIMYIDDKKVKEFCKDLWIEILKSYDSKNIVFISLGDEGKSDKVIIYHFAHENKISQDQIFNKYDKRVETLKNKIIIYIDDFSGTGKQFVEDWNEFKQECDIEFIRANRFIFAPLIISKNAIDYINENIKDSTFNLVYIKDNIFTEQNCAFSIRGNIYKDSNELETAKKIMEYYGINLYPKGGLGYHNAGYLIAFDYNVPNETLPIIWKKSEINFPWYPLYERKEISKDTKNNTLDVRGMNKDDLLIQLCSPTNTLSKEELISLQIYIDEFNQTLNLFYPTVKKRFFKNSWMIGIIIYGNNSGFAYSNFGIPLGFNAKLIQEHPPQVYHDDVKELLIDGWSFEPKSDFLKDPNKTARNHVQKKLNYLMNRYDLDNTGNEFLAEEFLINYIDHSNSILKLEFKNEYTLDEFEHALKQSTQEEEFSHTFLEIGSRKEVNKGIIIEFLDELKKRNINTIKRVYKTSEKYLKAKLEEMQNRNMIVGRAFMFTKGILLDNLRVFYRNLVPSVHTFINKNFPAFKDHFPVFNGATTIFIELDFSNTGSCEDQTINPRLVLENRLGLKNTDEKEVNFIICEKNENIKPEFTGIDQIISFGGKDYLTVFFSSGSCDYFDRDLPLLDSIYESFSKKHWWN